MQALEEFRALHGSCNPSCITTRCRRHDCSLKLPTRGIVCIDCDKCQCFPDQQKRPDFILLHSAPSSNMLHWIIVEMKGIATHAGKIVGQLQAGADVVSTDSSFQLGKMPKNLFAVILHDGHIRVADFARRKITFHGRKLPTAITIRRCGTKLADVIPH